MENWSASKLLGEHVGGSAVRSICFVSEIHMVASEDTDIPDGRSRQTAGAGSGENPFLLISVGAKRVLTSWLLRNRKHKDQQHSETGNGCKPSSGESSSMSFQWLSTDMPARYSSSDYYPEDLEKVVGATEHVDNTKDGARSFFPGKGKMGITSGFEDDWRYLAVTAFLVKCAGSRLEEIITIFYFLNYFLLQLNENFLFLLIRFTVCFVVVACSDATLVLRALILPCRLWY